MSFLTQEQRIYKAIKQSKVPRGVTNYQLASIALKYSSRIAELRQDGYNIVAVRDKLQMVEQLMFLDII